jgi:site-specific DNA-methyltransferase (adenine-specific)/site-specific DNA-methyltransferase (cytosine-N4-specific)
VLAGALQLLGPLQDVHDQEWRDLLGPAGNGAFGVSLAFHICEKYQEGERKARGLQDSLVKGWCSGFLNFSLTKFDEPFRKRIEGKGPPMKDYALRIAPIKPLFQDIPDGCLVIIGDALGVLKNLPDNSCQCCITSPPYWGLRDYGIPHQIGGEDRLEDYLSNLTEIFREVRRVLQDDGTLWLNIGDSYTSGNRTWRDADKKNPARAMRYRPPTPDGLKPKDLIGVPWRVAFSLQADGWFLRSDIIWYKPNCQPESVKDRPTRSHEYVFLFSKSEKYFYDHEAIKEQSNSHGPRRNRRTVWPINTEPFPGAHFAVFPPKLVEVCALAGSRRGDLVLDPFFGSGTLGEVCLKLQRKFIGIELNEEYARLAYKRLGWNYPES